jgi:leader peptidase (prepilin peptidase)/N-methyltransferase
MMIDILALKSTNPYVLYIIFGVLGAVIGSFLNVCIHRMPKGESVVWPRSKCPYCGEQLKWLDMIPVISFFVLRGRCRRCKGKIAHRYWIVEIITAAAFVMSAMLPSSGEIITGCVLSSILIGISGIDLEHFIIADGFIVWGSVLGIVCSIAFPVIHVVSNPMLPGFEHVQSGFRGLLGMMIGSGFGLWIMFFGERVFKKEAFGFGDVFLLGVIGSFCGWQGVFFSLFGGSVLAVCFLVPMMIVERVFGVRVGPRKVLDTEGANVVDASSVVENHLEQSSGSKEVALQFGVAIPFGPWLALAALIYYVWYRNELMVFFTTTVDAFLG